MIRDLAYVQWDPVAIVAPSHILTLWARLGDFRVSDLDKMLWDVKTIFLHWTPQASLVLTEDYPLYQSLMSRYPESLSGGWKSHEVSARKFLAGHTTLRGKVLKELKNGPLRLSEFEDHLRTRGNADAWTPSSDVSHMLFHLLMSGKVMVVGHQGNQNVWGVSEEFLPGWVEKKGIREEEFERQAALRAIQALGTATPAEINYYFVRGRYRSLKKTLALLQQESRIRRVEVKEFGSREERYIHNDDVQLLQSMGSDSWQPRISLLPPFDNLICSQSRTKRVFGFDYVREQFLPEEKRKYGTYVLPILWGDRLIGRLDPRMDRRNQRLVVNSVHAEAGAPKGEEVSTRIAEKVQGLADFLGEGNELHAPRPPAVEKIAPIARSHSSSGLELLRMFIE
ncbi:MAG: winged helix DNA-binding domain-containing protein [Thaumarchaeota archaeon]|nr:winged helix DNA-binding domain-containing protein [Nitrososphaerota archaeon]